MDNEGDGNMVSYRILRRYSKTFVHLLYDCRSNPLQLGFEPPTTALNAVRSIH